jgi:hypothetical protein
MSSNIQSYAPLSHSLNLFAIVKAYCPCISERFSYLSCSLK